MEPILEEIRILEPKRAAGILSRAALALESGDFNPAASPLEPGEIKLREKLISLIRESLPPELNSDNARLVSKIAERLDEQAERLVAVKDESAALERLSMDAVLGSDTYDVKFDDALPNIEGGLPHDRRRVEETIRNPGNQENFGPNLTPHDPSPVSLFGRWYTFHRERDRFLMIVAAVRQKKVMLVKHYWRVYPTDINIRGADTLADVFERFAQHYGTEFKIGDWHGKFLRYLKAPKDWKIEGQFGKGKFIFFVAFRLLPDKSSELAFGLNLNVTEYEKDVLKHTRFEKRV